MSTKKFCDRCQTVIGEREYATSSWVRFLDDAKSQTDEKNNPYGRMHDVQYGTDKSELCQKCLDEFRLLWNDFLKSGKPRPAPTSVPETPVEVRVVHKCDGCWWCKLKGVEV